MARKPIAKSKKSSAPLRAPAKKEQGEFSVALTLGDKKYEERGSTVLEALLKIQPQKVLFKGVFKVSRGDKFHEFPYRPFMLRRLFTNKVMQIVFQKRALFFLNA